MTYLYKISYVYRFTYHPAEPPMNSVGTTTLIAADAKEAIARAETNLDTEHRIRFQGARELTRITAVEQGERVDFP